MVIVWLAVAAVLLLFELHHLAFYALFGTLGCLAAAGVALAAPSAVGAQVGVAVAVALVGVVAVRPLVSRVFETHRGGHVAVGVHGGLAGQEAVTLDEVADSRVLGHVRLAGERWLAVSGGDRAIAPNTRVMVLAVRGTTLVVLPLDELGTGTVDIPSHETDAAPDGADGRTP